MSKAHADPAELRRFAQDLMRFTHEMRAMLSGMNARLNILEQGWQDMEHKKFAEQYEETARLCTKFLNASEEHAKFVAKKAELIEAYLRAR